ncbi:hypothetical protein ANO11243_014830 [Dothideomycetidae sp. 11243]|nr:hypothetical protein ANO11243_014830 [fungal sp. No.11243]
MPFGLSKKDKEKGEDEKRSALFGGRSKSTKGAAPDANPYAAVQSDPYASRTPDPYASQSSQPPAYSSNGSSTQLRQDKSPNRYGGSSSYGQTSGYGSNPYGSTSSQQATLQPQRPGGYGGLGRSNSTETTSTDAGRAALFGDAPTRVQQRNPAASGSTGPSTAEQNFNSTYGGNDGESSFAGGYGGYQDRELTAEEQEQEDVQASKNEIRFIKQQDVSSTRNARRIAEQAEATGRETLARLGQQGERIFNAERNLDLASAQNRIAQEKASELKTLNRSMFAVHVSNPFTKSRREQDANNHVLDKHREERLRADATRKEMQESATRNIQAGRGIGGAAAAAEKQRSLAQRSKYQFEADSEDEAMENEIDENLDAIHRGAKTLNALGKAMGEELDSQNKHINRIIGKTDLVDDEIALNRARLDRIH